MFGKRPPFWAYANRSEEVNYQGPVSLVYPPSGHENRKEDECRALRISLLRDASCYFIPSGQWVRASLKVKNELGYESKNTLQTFT